VTAPSMDRMHDDAPPYRARSTSDTRQSPTPSSQPFNFTDDTSHRQIRSSQASTTLHRSTYIVGIVIIYSALSLVSWGVICILTERPLTGGRYGYMSNAAERQVSRRARDTDYAANERWYQAMRVIQAIVGVLTIPITSAVCSSAAAAFAQYSKLSAGLSMRQLIALADRGWTDPRTFLRLMSWNGFRRSGSMFLVLAIALNILGGLIQPLQQVFLNDISVKTPLYKIKLYHIFDTTNVFHDREYWDDGSVVLMTRNSLATTSLTEPMNQLWQGEGFSCDAGKLHEDSAARAKVKKYESPPAACGYGATLGNFSSLLDPFLAQLPSTFSSGVVRQFLPRFNSSTTYSKVAASGWPAECSTAAGSYSISYENTSTDNPWSVAICMPGDLRHTPWKRTHARQDFGEVLYLNISRSDAGQPLETGGSLFQIVMNTTGGYFELPNYMNRQMPGYLPLLLFSP